MVLLQTFLLVGGSLILLFGVAKFEKKREPIAYVLLGIIYIVLGVLVKDPPETLIIAPTVTDITVVAAIVSLSAVLGRAIVWIITRTDLYHQVSGALTAATVAVTELQKIDQAAIRIRDDYEAAHHLIPVDRRTRRTK